MIGNRTYVEDPYSGVVKYSADVRKVAIVGSGRGREDAPYGDPSWTCWALNEIWMPTYDIMFELHPREVQDELDMRCLAGITSPCYVLDPSEWPLGAPAAPVRFPIEEIYSAFGRLYFTCTFAYQLALALLRGFDEVGLWGCGLHHGTARERLVERPCLDYWIGRAEGMGVQVVEDSGLARQGRLYGYAYRDEVSDVDAQVTDMRDVIEFERRVE